MGLGEPHARHCSRCGELRSWSHALVAHILVGETDGRLDREVKGDVGEVNTEEPEMGFEPRSDGT